jgi:hypothetical protein
MLFARSHAWTLGQRWLIAGAVVASLCVFSALVYSYERYHRGPDESFFVGTWRGDYLPKTLYWGPARVGFHFRSDHTYEGETAPSGRWYAAGDFLYLRLRLDDASGPYDRLETWHTDSMSGDELRMHSEVMGVALRRIK